MENIYISEEYCTVHLAGNSFLIKKNGFRLASLPLYSMKTLTVTEHVQFTSQALRKLMDNNIDVTFTTRGGKMVGRIYAKQGGNVILRLAQHEKWKNSDMKKEFAKELIHAKALNQIHVLRKYRYYHLNALLSEHIKTMEKLLKQLDECQYIDEFLGFEGVLAKEYFEAFNELLLHDCFPGRIRRPATDPVNALLNLGYSFLCNEMASRLSSASFDLEIGFLHSIRYGRKSLAMDIMEPFRPSFIDEWILTILNKKQISSEQFLHSSGTSKCMLDKEGFQQFCRLYQKHKEDKVNQKTWAGIFDDEVRQLRRYVMGETDIYQTFIKL